ncbi:MAG: glycosyltransferase [Deltaproteobacteria bacterium]|nr:glycosyltransferase [Deltaproteobacteria bacterium]
MKKRQETDEVKPMLNLEKPKVTVLISTFNRPKYLAEAIESVVNQRFQDWELIVMNDGGVNVQEVVDKFADPRITYVDDTRNRGAAYRFNRGLDMARGEYICYLGDDDIFYPNHIEVLAKALDENPQVALAYSDLYGVSSVADKSGKRYVLDKRVSVSRGFNREFMFHYNHVLHVSVMHRLEAARRVGGFDQRVKVLIEWSLNRRLAFLYDFHHVEEPTGEYHMAVFKSDRISVRERRDNESYKHNLRKIRTNYPAEPWDKIRRVDMLYPVDEWGENLNRHLLEIIDNFDYPFYIYLIDNGTGRTMKEIRTSLGRLLELKNIKILNLSQRQANPIMACRIAAKSSNAEFFFLASPKLAAAKQPKRLFATFDFLEQNPGHRAIRWAVEEEKDSPLDCLIERDYFMRCTRPGVSRSVRIQALSINLAKGFKFDAMFTEFKKKKSEKKFEEARRLLDSILEEKEGFPHIQYLIHYLAPICLAQKDYDTLERELKGLIDRGYRADNLIRLGVMLGRAGRWPEAVTALKEALAAHGLTEDDFKADCFPFDLGRKLSVFYLLMALGESSLEINDHVGAAHYYHLASKIKSADYEPFLGFTRVWLATGQIERAETTLASLPAPDAAKKDPETHRLLGKICQKRKDLNLAYQCYKKAFELRPEEAVNVDPLYYTGAALGQWEDMLENLQTFTRHEPKDANGQARLAAVCFQLKLDGEAAEAVERCLELEPSHPVAKSLKGRLAARLPETPPEIAAVVGPGGLSLDLAAAPLTW